MMNDVGFTSRSEGSKGGQEPSVAAAWCPQRTRMSPPEQNYRSIGRGTGGVPTKSKNVFKRHVDFVTIPSIPAKFETVLYRGNNEEKGFGSRTPRFGQEQRPDEKAPGPGAYPVTKLAVLSQAGTATAACVGERGNGAFASRKDRFKQRIERKPGPGTYEAPEKDLGQPKSIQDVRNAAFVPSTSVNPAKSRVRVSPGPGDYRNNPVSATWGKGGIRFPRTGEDSDERVDFGINSNPGPGDYEEALLKPRSASEGHGRTGRRRLLVPAEDLSHASLLRMDADRITEEIVSGGAANSQTVAHTPGPGSYEPQITATKGRTAFGTGESSCFRVGNSHLPRKWDEASPGPCDYESLTNMSIADGRRTDPTAPVFSSVTPRFKDSATSAPGPAYYSPRSARRLNQFHLNTSRGWV